MSWEDILKVKYRTDERIDFPYDERLNPRGTGIPKKHEHNFSYEETEATKKEAIRLLEKITGESHDEVMSSPTEEEYDKTMTAKILQPYWNWMQMWTSDVQLYNEHLVEWLKAGYPKDWIEFKESDPKYKPADYGLGHHGYPKPKKGDEQ
tara:strand:+ start:857 stop:1306 length:450 start_codon:yes stop_codon:yes gene_type:complete